MRTSEQLSFENRRVLDLVQASLGGITRNIRSISLSCEGHTVHIHFLLRRRDPVDTEEIEDMIFEFEALQDTVVDIEVHVTESEEQFGTGAAQVPGRAIFIRRSE